MDSCLLLFVIYSRLTWKCMIIILDRNQTFILSHIVLLQEGKVYGTKLWNSLSPSIKNLVSFNLFRHHYIQYILAHQQYLYIVYKVWLSILLALSTFLFVLCLFHIFSLEFCLSCLNCFEVTICFANYLNNFIICYCHLVVIQKRKKNIQPTMFDI